MNELEMLTRLRKGKDELRARRRNLSLPEKVAEVVALQRVVLPAYRRRRALEPWEKVWPLTGRDPTKE